jgi:hypothetical protein
VKNSSVVSLTLEKQVKTAKASSLTGVVDTGERFLTSVNDVGNLCFAGVFDTGEATEKSNISANNQKKSNLYLDLSSGTGWRSLRKNQRRTISWYCPFKGLF